MAQVFKTDNQVGVACLFFVDIHDAKTLSEWLKRHRQWRSLHDQVMASYRQPLVALPWRGYTPGDIAEHDTMLDIFGVTLLTPREARDMVHGIRAKGIFPTE